MRIVITLLMLLIGLLGLSAQTDDCSNCTDHLKFMQQGNEYLKAQVFDKALFEFQAAQLAARVCKCSSTEPAQGIEKAIQGIQAQKDEAERQRDAAEAAQRLAQAARDEAESLRIRATEALAQLQSSLGQVLDLILQQTEEDILNLNYVSALNNVRVVVGLETNSEKIRPYAMELSYFYGEIGELEQAYQLADTVSQLYGQASVLPAERTLVNLRALLHQIDSNHYDDLEKRYYPEMLFIEGDTMSSSDPAAEEAYYYTVQLDDYRMARTETTNWQYHLFCEATGLDRISRTQEGWPLTGDVPVVNVNWYDAVQYANWVSLQMNVQPAYDIKSLGDEDIQWLEQQHNAQGYRLPTESEWEFAARGGKKAKADYLFSGSNDRDSVGWFYPEESNSRAHAVGEKKANDLGLVDMSGNVWEWCWDWHYSYPNQATVYLNSRGPAQGEDRILRGGSWYGDVVDIGVSHRGRSSPFRREGQVGFRLAQGY